MLRAAACVIVLVSCGPAPFVEEAAGQTADEHDGLAPACRALRGGGDDDWRWVKRGVVEGIPLEGDGALAPAILVDTGQVHLWYTQKSGLQHVLVHAISRDRGASFHAREAVRGLGDDLVTAYPSVWREGGRFMLVYGSGSFNLATSEDGVAFVKVAERVLTASGDPARFDAYAVVYPSRFGEQLFFTGFDGRHIRIGRALAQADGRFVVDPPAPVLDVGEASAFDGAAVAQPQVKRARNGYVMWYGGYDTSVSDPGPYRIGFAESHDGVAWQKRGVAIPLSEHGTDAFSTRDPAVAAVDGKWLMLYAGLGEDGRYRLHRATSDVCGL